MFFSIIRQRYEKNQKIPSVLRNFTENKKSPSFQIPLNKIPDHIKHPRNEATVVGNDFGRVQCQEFIINAGRYDEQRLPRLLRQPSLIEPS
jgi:hypothetical protein